MKKAQIPIKNIQFSNSFDFKSKLKAKSIRSKQIQRKNKQSAYPHLKIITALNIKQKNASLSRKTYNNLKKFTDSKTLSSKANSDGRRSFDRYKVSSVQLQKNQDPQYNNFIYKPFPKRQSFVKNNNAVKYFFQNPINPQIQTFANEDFYIDVKLSNLTMIKSFCPSDIGNNTSTNSKEFYSPLKQRIASSRIMRQKNKQGFHQRYQTNFQVKSNKISPWQHFPAQQDNQIVSHNQQN